MILAGDIGGTNSRLLLARVDAGKITLLQQHVYSSLDYPGLLPIVQHFLQEQGVSPGTVQSACFAVAGPVRGQTASITNLPWVLDADVLADTMQIPCVRLINDFAGVAYGLQLLEPADVIDLNQVEASPTGPRLVLGAGTGLGAAALVPHAEGYSILTTEAGHIDFAPHDDEDLALFHYWRERLPRLSYETFLSGVGLERIYEFHAAAGGVDAPESGNGPVPAAVISAAGLSGEDILAVKTLEQFIRIYAACAGNLALAFKATGGVYIAGGIAPRLAAKIETGDFLEVFYDKPPMISLLQTMPVKLVLNTRIGILGAAVVAGQAV